MYKWRFLCEEVNFRVQCLRRDNQIIAVLKHQIIAYDRIKYKMKNR